MVFRPPIQRPPLDDPEQAGGDNGQDENELDDLSLGQLRNIGHGDNLRTGV